MNFENFEKYSENDTRRMFEQLSEMRAHSPGLTLFDRLEFCEYLDETLKIINDSEKPREIILEAWLLIDYIITYMLRDGLNIPEEIENEFNLLPFTFSIRKKVTINKEA